MRGPDLWEIIYNRAMPGRYERVTAIWTAVTSAGFKPAFMPELL